MALKLIQPYEPIEVKTIVTCVYAAPGLGRTTLCYTADKPVLFDFDQAAHRAKLRKTTVPIASWADAMDVTAEDLAPFNTVVIDTAGKALDMLALKIMSDDPKLGSGGQLAQRGWGKLKVMFSSWVKMLRSFGKDIVFAAHMDEQKDGEDWKERLDVQGGSKNFIYQLSDCMGRIFMRGGKRTLNFSPTDTAFGKNPAQLPPIDVPGLDKLEGFLGGVIAQTKAALNAMSAEQAEVAGLLQAWVEMVARTETAEQFNALIEAGKGLDERIKANAKRVLGSAAIARGLVFDKAAGAFVGQNATQAPGHKTPDGPGTTAPPADTAPEAPSGPATPLDAAALGKGARKASRPVEREPEAREPGSDDE